MKKFFIFLFTIALLFLGIANKGYAQKAELKNQPSKSPKVQKPLFYYPVPFIPVLKDMEYVAEKSAVLKTPDLVTGMLVFKGNYSAKSLLNFYKVQMKNNGWKEVGSFTSKISFIAYERPEGTAFISISEGLISTELRIVVILNKLKE